MNKKKLLGKLKLKKSKKVPSLNHVILILITLGAVFLIVFISKFAYLKLPHPKVADYLLGEKVVVYAEFSEFKLSTGEEEMPKLIGEPFGINLNEAMSELGNGKVAAAYVTENFEVSQPVIFIETKSKRQTMKYFESLLLENESLVKIEGEKMAYSYPIGQAFSFKLIGRYVAIAKNASVFSLISETQIKSLSLNGDYIKSVSNLPRKSWVFVYTNFQNVSFADNSLINNVAEPLKYAINHLALSVKKDKNGLKFNTFLNLNKELISIEKGEKEGKFTYRLADYILSDDIALYVGGTNLKAEWQNTLETISNLSPAYEIILEGLLRAQIDEIFGESVDLRNDIYPLFENEYALAVSKNGGKKVFTLILAHDDKLFSEKKLEKMIQGFKLIAASLTPKISNITLPDGTISRELIPDGSKVLMTEEESEGYKIICAEISGKKNEFCYSITDEIIIMTNSKEQLINSISPSENKNSLLSNNENFRKTLGNLSKVNDELTFINFENLGELMKKNEYIQNIQPFLSKLKAASYIKHYFDDGVSTEGYILLK